MVTVSEFIKGFVSGKYGNFARCGNWKIINWGGMDVLQYHSTTEKTRSEYSTITGKWEYNIPDGLIQEKPETIAYKLPDGSILVNSNELQYAAKYSYGRRNNRRGGQSDCQIQLENLGAIPFPFTIFNEVPGSDVRDFAWIVKSRHEIVVEWPEWYDYRASKNVRDASHANTRHFSGACIFTIAGEYFLFDIDRQEITDHHIFNPFVTKLPGPANSINEAYDLLIPGEVKKAIAAGVEVKRQGEFFFIYHSPDCPVKVELTKEEREILRYPPSRIGFGIIPTGTTGLVWRNDDTRPIDPDHYSDKGMLIDTPEKEEFNRAAYRYKEVQEKFDLVRSKPGSLGKSATGSHNVEKFVQTGEISYVSGKVTQNRRQHGDLILNGWYKVVPNTGVLSWTITGKID